MLVLVHHVIAVCVSIGTLSKYVLVLVHHVIAVCVSIGTLLQYVLVLVHHIAVCVTIWANLK